jgi:ribosomal protein S18 acetylase RimI-like enzyme
MSDSRRRPPATAAKQQTAAPQLAPGRVRRAVHADDAAILELEEHFPSDRLSLRSLRRFLKSDHVPVWVAELHGTVVGSLILLTRRNSRRARIYSVVVAPQARGRRLGERMVRAAETFARRQGLVAVSLEVRADNAAARGLYGKLGYGQVRTLPGYYEDGGDGLLLRKDLPR